MVNPVWDIPSISMSSTGIPSPHCHATINHRGDFTDDFNHNREERREQKKRAQRVCSVLHLVREPIYLLEEGFCGGGGGGFSPSTQSYCKGRHRNLGSDVGYSSEKFDRAVRYDKSNATSNARFLF